jgi:tRNA pseudouridine55 synthase
MKHSQITMKKPNRQTRSNTDSIEGILLIDKPQGWTSFSLIRLLRKRLGVQKIGHAGTLDPLATGLMVLLIGRRYTRLSEKFLCNDKEYNAIICLGITTDTYDREGRVLEQSSTIPTFDDIEQVLKDFQGEIEQIPPMFSAKKRQGKKLYELARKGQEIPREPVKVRLDIALISYSYPYLELRVACSKGTYIRSLAFDVGKRLGCGAHLASLRRTRSGPFEVSDGITEKELNSTECHLIDKLLCVSLNN